ncbi:hypothetical protein [Halorubrum ezzemoulense]|uniref:hypothetical protein n=1 Tax=Halorubrum ezzemoulense TaxID=337243 RepID=UPI00232E274F|nr:hypothetical protein [Halorubrum ezzemoulense]
MTHTDTPQSRIDPPIGSLRARDPVSIGALVILLGVIAITGMTRELLIAVPLLLVAGVLPAPIAFATGQLAVFPTISLEATLLVGVTQLALLCVLTEPARRHQRWAVFIGTLPTYGLLVAVVAIGLREGLVVAGGLLCVAVIVGTYLARRVTLVQLGRVALDHTPSVDDAGGAETTTAVSTDETAGETSVPDTHPDTDPSSELSETDEIQSNSLSTNDESEPKR